MEMSASLRNVLFCLAQLIAFAAQKTQGSPDRWLFSLPPYLSLETQRRFPSVWILTVPIGDRNEADITLYRQHNRRPSIIGNSNWQEGPYALYQNLSMGAAFLMRGIRSHLQLTGHFEVDGQHFSVEPYGPMNQHSVWVDNSADFEADSMMPPEGTERADILKEVEAHRLWKERRQRYGFLKASTEGSKTYCLELFIIFDYEAYYKFQLPSNSSGDKVKEISYYLVQFANLMDVRFRSIQSSRYTLSLTLTKVEIITSPYTQPNFNRHSFSWGGGRAIYGTDIKSALNAYTDLIPTSTRYDHLLLVTGLDLADRKRNGRVSTKLLGITTIGDICDRRRSNSVVEYIGGFTAAFIATHEITHSLGAQHDGWYSSARCLSSRQYIMAGALNMATSGNEKNYYAFSPCSIDAVGDLMEALSTRSINCLESECRQGIDLNGLKYPPVHQSYTSDDLCKQHYGSKWAYQGGSEGKLICHRLSCVHLENGEIRVSSSAGRGLPGFSCGFYQWCENGECVFNFKASSVNDGCPQGDSRAFVNPPYTCSQVNKNPQLCYLQQVKRECCNACLKARGPIQTCEYGDKDPRRCSLITASQCATDPRLKTSCCSSCRSECLQYRSYCPYPNLSICQMTFVARCCTHCELVHGINGRTTTAVGLIPGPTTLKATLPTTPHIVTTVQPITTPAETFTEAGNPPTVGHTAREQCIADVYLRFICALIPKPCSSSVIPNCCRSCGDSDTFTPTGRTTQLTSQITAPSTTPTTPSQQCIRDIFSYNICQRYAYPCSARASLVCCHSCLFPRD